MKRILWYLFRLLGRQWRQVIGLLLLGTVDVVLSLAVIAVSKQVIDVATGASGGYLWHSIAVLGGLFAISIVIRNGYARMTAGMQLTLLNRLTGRFLDSVLRSQWLGISRYHSGDIMSRIHRDLEDVTGLWTVTVPQLVLTFLKLCGAFAFLYSMEPDLALLLAGLIPAVLVLSKLYFRKMRQLSLGMKRCWSLITGYFQEAVQNMEPIKAFRLEWWVDNQLEEKQMAYADVTGKHIRFSFYSRLVLAFGFTAGYLLTFSWGLFRLQEGMITFGTMTAFLQLVNMIQGPALSLVGLVPGAITAYTAGERLLELDGLPKEFVKEELRIPELSRVCLSDVSFGYQKERPVIRHLNLCFEKGKMYALSGVTGCGKTTLIRLLLGFVSPDSGQVWLEDGGENRYPVSAETRVNFAYVPQDMGLFSGTIRDNLRIVNPQAMDEELYEALHHAAADFVREMPEGLDTQLKEQGKGLSGGQIQRLSIARAWLAPGGVLLLDEITSALDAETGERVIRALKKNIGDRIVILVSHKQEVMEMCDHVFHFV